MDDQMLLAGLAAAGAVWMLTSSRKASSKNDSPCSARHVTFASAKAAQLVAEPKTAEEFKMDGANLDGFFQKSEGFDEQFKGTTVVGGKAPKNFRETLDIKDVRLEKQTRLGNGTTVLVPGVSASDAPQPEVKSECVREMFSLPPALEGRILSASD